MTPFNSVSIKIVKTKVVKTKIVKTKIIKTSLSLIDDHQVVRLIEVGQ